STSVPSVRPVGEFSLCGSPPRKKPVRLACRSNHFLFSRVESEGTMSRTSLRKVLSRAMSLWSRTLPARHRPSPNRRHTYKARLEPLETRLVPAITLVPEPAGGVAGLAGNLVEFRKAPAGFISGAADGLA